MFDHPMTKELKLKNAIKEVVCVGGDRLTVRGKDYYCNEVHLDRAKDMSQRGERVDNFKYSGIVPAGSFFVMGHTIDSFDSRYFGFIRTGDLKKIAHPLF
jgi:signal peptidase I